MDSDQRRRRKRIGRPLSASSMCLSVRSLILCLTFLIFLYLLSTQIPVARSAFRPILKASSFPLLSTATSSTGLHFSSAHLKIEGRVLFPDHVLLIIAYGNNKRQDRRLELELECVYYKDLVSGHEVERKAVISSDVYEHNEYIVRCPLPPANYSTIVNLNKRGERIYHHSLPGISLKVPSWETLAYAAALDGNSAVVLVKGLNLRSYRQSDPRQFTCHFGGKQTSILTTKAISAAQEVVRCSLPRSIQMNPNKAEGIPVTIGMKARIHSKTENHVLVPSVAKILNPTVVMKNSSKKYELCVCTMAWNQASALREWIIYHSWLGVERWFIYDNNSNDGTPAVIEELGSYNVSRHVWPWIKTQEAGFSHCAIRARTQCNWVGFFDVDEFFYFPPNEDEDVHSGHRKLGQGSLKNLVRNFSTTKVGEIRTSCHSFGPSGLSSAPSKGVTVGYTCRLQSPERHKSIVRPEALEVSLLNAIHHFRLKNGFESVNLHQSRGLINHYKYQVWDSFKAKFFRRVATYVADWQENQNEGSKDRAPGLGTEAIEPSNWSLKFCEVWDTGLRDFILSNMADSFSGLLPWEDSDLLL